MNSAAFFNKMATVIDADPMSLSTTTPLDDHNWDSLALIGAIAAIDECYNVTVPADLLLNCKTLGDVMALIQDKVQNTDSKISKGAVL